jgi:hypothetical protein
MFLRYANIRAASGFPIATNIARRLLVWQAVPPSNNAPWSKFAWLRRQTIIVPMLWLQHQITSHLLCELSITSFAEYHIICWVLHHLLSITSFEWLIWVHWLARQTEWHCTPLICIYSRLERGMTYVRALTRTASGVTLHTLCIHMHDHCGTTSSPLSSPRVRVIVSCSNTLSRTGATYALRRHPHAMVTLGLFVAICAIDDFAVGQYHLLEVSLLKIGIPWSRS